MKTHKPACLTRFASSAIAAAIAWMAVSLCPAEPAPRGTEFPLMMYAAGNPPGFSAISPYGWNVLQDYGVDTTSKINSHLQACATNGTYGPAPIPMGGTNSDSESSKFEMSPTDTQNWIQAVAGNPGLTWWNMPEEPRNWLRSEIAMLASYSARTRMTDPLRRPNYLAIDTFQTIGQMTAVIPAVDVLGLEIYPEYAYKPHAFVRYYMERGITAIKQAGYTIGTNYLAGQKLPIGIIWVAEDHGVVPTPAQTYHDIWAIIASGGQGVSMYGHWWAVNTNPLLLDCLAQANTAASQINGSEHLGDVILRGTEDPNVGFSILSGPTQTETFTATGGGNESVTLSSLKVLCKVHGGNVYVIAVNSTDQPVTASITNLATNAASATALFQARTVGISSGALTDTFPAWGVNIYKMALNAGSAPAAPTNVTATPQSGSAIALSWQASGGATSYSIKASLNAGGPYVAVATGITGTSHTHLGLSSNTTYYYVVSATNHYGESVNSSQVTGLTQTWTRVNNTSDRILYNAMSLQSGSTGDYQNDNHFGNSADTSAEFTFAGTGVQAIAVKDSSGGNVEVYLDGVLKTTVSCNNATKQQQQVIYTTSGLAGGPHKLKLVRKTNTLRLDAFDVQTASVPMGNNAPVFSSDPIMRPNATVGVAYAATLADSAADVDAGDPLIYAKVSGPAWLSIAGNGTLSGTPAAGNAGANPFTVSVTDAGGHTTQAALNITVASPSNPTWITAPGGSWASAGNWTNGVIANGVDKTADFSALNLSADTTVTLDGARTVGGLTFGDTTPSHSWVLNTGSGGPLTLAVSSGAPAINVIHTRFAIINAVIAGTKGFIKTGAGALWLTGANTYTGVTTVSGGMIQVSGNQPAANGGWAINGNTIVNLLTGSSVAVASGKSIDFANTSGNYHSMTVGGAVTNAGSLTMGGASGLTISAGGNWSQSGAIMLAPNWSYEIARINVNVGGTFTYTGGTDIELRTNNAAPGVSDTSVLNLSGGTFTTGKGFINNISGVNATNGSANLWFSNGGVLKLTANITTLATTATRPFNVQLGMGGGKIDTNGFTTTITQGIANISGQIGSLSKQGLGTLTLSGASTYTGATTVEGGTLAITGSLANTAVEVKGSAKLTAGGSLGGAVTIRPNGHLGFVLAATPGAQPARTIGGVLTLDAGNILDFSAAATPAVGVYVLATASSISGTPGTVNLPAGVNGAVTVVGNSLRLTITPPGYSAWIAIYSVGGETAANDDADQDGLPNAVEFVLGTDPTHASGSGITAQSSGGNFIVTFHRSDASESSGLQLFVEGGPLPGSSSQVLAIGASSSSNVSVIENSTAPDTVIVTLPTGGASKFFARLKVVITGS